MTELLILLVLITKPFNIYEIKKNIDEICGCFLDLSLGGVVTTSLKKLEQNQYVKSEQTFSKGGLRKRVYTITESGLKYIEELIKQPLSTSPQNAIKEINTIACIVNSKKLSEEQNKILIEKAVFALNTLKTSFKKFNENKDFVYIKDELLSFEKKLEWLNGINSDPSPFTFFHGEGSYFNTKRS